MRDWLVIASSFVETGKDCRWPSTARKQRALQAINFVISIRHTQKPRKRWRSCKCVPKKNLRDRQASCALTHRWSQLVQRKSDGLSALALDRLLFEHAITT